MNVYFYNGKIKIWWRDNDRLEFVCNGEFGAAKRDEPRRLQSLLIKANEEKRVIYIWGSIIRAKILLLLASDY